MIEELATLVKDAFPGVMRADELPASFAQSYSVPCLDAKYTQAYVDSAVRHVSAKGFKPAKFSVLPYGDAARLDLWV
jgi:hypothetical protein